ncbi:helix-turn-helix transcriptional regulator [Streptomyces sp. PDY-4]|uniref:helix-turn-helix transcriptional regulator n=1 Tax=Streptomyces sp. PDY-4 TaxID=3376070 RepID=UPI0037A8C0AC
MSSQELADFLRRRREGLQPEDAPAEATRPPSQRARRTPGLRREEVAALAQVSVSYYERLEQARAPGPHRRCCLRSRRLSSSLKQSVTIWPAWPDKCCRQRTTARQSTYPRMPNSYSADLTASLPTSSTTGKTSSPDAAAAALITDFVPPHLTSATSRASTRFRDTLCTGAPGSESDFSQQAAAQLRAASVRYPTDNVLAELINEFATHDPDFASSWRNHAVHPVLRVRKNLHHPTLGELEIDRHTLSLPGSGFSLVMYTAEAGSPSAAALKSL